MKFIAWLLAKVDERPGSPVTDLAMDTRAYMELHGVGEDFFPKTKQGWHDWLDHEVPNHAADQAIDLAFKEWNREVNGPKEPTGG